MQNHFSFFWEWFQRHSKIFINLPQKPQREFDFWANHLQVMLAACCHKRVGGHIDWLTDAAMPRLIITAHGDRRYFKRIEALVNEAPVSLPWEVMAFEPPRPLDYLIKQKFSHIDFNPYDLCFQPLELWNEYTHEPPVLIVYAATENELNYTYKNAVENVVYNLLGEKSVVQDLSGIEVKPLSSLSEAQIDELTDLEWLPNFIVDLSPPTYTINRQGKLLLK